MSTEVSQLIFSISDIWCLVCAKNIRESVTQIEGIHSGDLSYWSLGKLSPLEEMFFMLVSSSARLYSVFGLGNVQEARQ